MIKIGQSAAKLLSTFEMNGYEERSTTTFPEAWDDEGAFKSEDIVSTGMKVSDGNP